MIQEVRDMYYHSCTAVTLQPHCNHNHTATTLQPHCSHTATRWNILQHTGSARLASTCMLCNTLQPRCRPLQHTETKYNKRAVRDLHPHSCTATTLQPHCNYSATTLQPHCNHTATTPQRIATHRKCETRISIHAYTHCNTPLTLFTLPPRRQSNLTTLCHVDRTV